MKVPPSKTVAHKKTVSANAARLLSCSKLSAATVVLKTALSVPSLVTRPLAINARLAIIEPVAPVSRPQVVLNSVLSTRVSALLATLELMSRTTVPQRFVALLTQEFWCKLC